MSGIIASFESATLDELRAEWGRRFGAPPRPRSPDLLRQILAWRIQASSEGGRDGTTKRLLVKDGRAGDALLVPGTIVARVWKGVRYEVEATRGMGDPYIRKLISLAFLAPDIQRAILEGRQPAGLTLGDLIARAIPLDWRKQREALGLA